MKSISVRDAKDGFSDCLRQSQGETVVILKHGHPVAVLVGVEGMDPEDVYWGLNQELLKQISKSRRRRRTISHDDVVRQFGRRQKKPKTAA